MKQHKPTQKEFDDVFAMLRMIDEYMCDGTLGDDGDDIDHDSPFEAPCPENRRRVRRAT